MFAFEKSNGSHEIVKKATVPLTFQGIELNMSNQSIKVCTYFESYLFRKFFYLKLTEK